LAQSKVIIVLGVSGCGKTSVGKALGKSLQIPFYDADDFHPKANIEKMRSGTPLNDDDRWPWLDTLSRKLLQWQSEGGAVLACSALKEMYREQLSSKTKVDWVYLDGDFNTIYERMKQRNHFMKPELLQSQFDTLEVPSYGKHISVTKTVDQIVKELTSYFKS